MFFSSVKYKKFAKTLFQGAKRARNNMAVSCYRRPAPSPVILIVGSICRGFTAAPGSLRDLYIYCFLLFQKLTGIKRDRCKEQSQQSWQYPSALPLLPFRFMSSKIAEPACRQGSKCPLDDVWGIFCQVSSPPKNTFVIHKSITSRFLCKDNLTETLYAVYVTFLWQVIT